MKQDRSSHLKKEEVTNTMTKSTLEHPGVEFRMQSSILHDNDPGHGLKGTISNNDANTLSQTDTKYGDASQLIIKTQSPIGGATLGADRFKRPKTTTATGHRRKGRNNNKSAFMGNSRGLIVSDESIPVQDIPQNNNINMSQNIGVSPLTSPMFSQ